MEDSLKLYWELVFEKVSTKEILRQLNNPIRQYEDEMVDGAIVDIGCGQSAFLLDFASTNREFIAIDNEQIQLDFLKKRVESLEAANIDNWKFYNQNFPIDSLPNKEYSLIIFSNLLHFFTLDECVEIGKLVSEKSINGTLVYVKVHSDKFYANNPKNPNNNDYFKHFFTIYDLETVFPTEIFERIYYAEIEKVDSKSSCELTEEWLDRFFKANKITDTKCINSIKKERLQNKTETCIVAIFRKRKNAVNEYKC